MAGASGARARAVSGGEIAASRVASLPDAMESSRAVVERRQPVLEHGPTPEGPWTLDVAAQVLETAPGRYEATTTATAVAGFFRIATEAGPCCIFSIERAGASVTLEFAVPHAETDGDGVPDCEDTCPGHDDRLDADGDGVPDACDACPGHDDGTDADADGTPDGCDLCLGFSDVLYAWLDENDDGIADCAQAPAWMSWIAPGSFQMGDTYGEFYPEERPVHWVYVSAFYMDRHEVTKALWDEVQTWALAHGYSFARIAEAKGPQHPVWNVDWASAAKWCNARSEHEGLTPVYRLSSGEVLRTTGAIDDPDENVLWGANGYRLPTEAEWEKAARGGLHGKLFPWGDTISHSEANYYSAGFPAYDVSPTRWYHPDYYVTPKPYTSPVGSFPPNGYGLYDMAGNVSEWCWDWYFYDWYSQAGASASDPRGFGWKPADQRRAVRGGAADRSARDVRCSRREGYEDYRKAGFRCVRRQTPRDSDFDGDGLADREDLCPFDPGKTSPGVCGCGLPDRDSDQDGTLDCLDPCPYQPDSDGDGIDDCEDGCPDDPGKIEPGLCGCNVPDVDTDGDGVPDCHDACAAGDDRFDTDWDTIPDACDDWVDPDGDGVSSAGDVCPGADDGVDADADSIPDCLEWLPPATMMLVPAGEFEMGDTFAEGQTSERPVHTVYVRAFLIDRCEVTKALWDEVYAWAIEHGYAFDYRGSSHGQAGNHPVCRVNWYDAVKWCNARSEKEGMTPCHYTTFQHETVYRTGQLALSRSHVKWDADGYRLPTEAEWEKAARGGLAGRRFPWGYTASHSQANFIGSPSSYPYDLSATSGYHPAYHVGSSPYTSPVNSFPVNGYLLCNMAGNVAEWCWDRYAYDWYGRSEAREDDTSGPSTGWHRVLRGGSWVGRAYALRCASRSEGTESVGDNAVGFRCARRDPGLDSDGDGVADLLDMCLRDPGKSAPGQCGCGVPEPGQCGCGVPDDDQDGDGIPDCLDQCPGFDDRQDSDGDGIPDGCQGPAPDGMVWIPDGPFVMGDALDEGSSIERPAHTVWVSEFYLDRMEVTEALWDRVHAWAIDHGYSIRDRAAGKGPAYPATGIAWYEAVKWCNARSEMEGLTPTYRTPEGGVVLAGQVHLQAEHVSWSANGYRLPTEAEWEKAARGRAAGRRFPWGNTITHSHANYYSSATYSYDVAATRGYHPDYDNGLQPHTSPVRSLPCHGYWAYELVGNVREWCWDRYDAGWYGRAEASTLDPRGPSSGGDRVVRGGGWSSLALDLRCASRSKSYPSNRYEDHGFRCARSSR